VTYDGELQTAFVGQAVTLTLTDEIDISRGDMIVLDQETAKTTNHLSAHLVWMTEQPMQPGREYFFKFASKLTVGQVENIHHRIDVNTQEKTRVSQLQLNDIAKVELVLNQSVLVDPYKVNRTTGAFIVIDRLTNITVGAGMVIESLAEKTLNKTNFSEFELELNALIRKHFPHWDAKDISLF
jgi:sulfate adenylyltransferase subunit 1